MADYPYEGQLIADPVTFQRATSAQITVYDISDTGNSTPLALKDMTGLPLANPLTSSGDAFTRPFFAPSQDIKMVGAGLTVTASSPKGMRDAAAASALAAQAAATNAGAAAAADIAARIAAGQFKGDKGVDGSNVLPTNDAIAAAVTATGPTKTVLNATYAPVIGLGVSNGNDDTAALNALLAVAGNKTARGLPGQTYITTGPLIIPSGVVLDMRGCTVRLKAGSNKNMLNNTAVATGRTVADASTTAASTTLTSATIAFTSADVGKPVSIQGAGVNGRRLNTTIASVTNATTAVLAVAATTATTNQALTIGPRDKNITLLGGTWDRGANSGTGLDLHSFRLRRVDGLTVRDIKFLSTAGKHAFNLGDADDYTFDNILFDAYSDGVHISGPAYRGSITNIKGRCADDLVALGTGDYPQYLDVYGDIIDCDIRSLHADMADTSVVIVKVYGGQSNTWKAENILIDGVHGATGGSAVALVGGGVQGAGAGLPLQLNKCVVQNVDAKCGGSLIIITCNAGKDITLRDIKYDKTGGANAVINISNDDGTTQDASVLRLLIDGVTVNNIAANVPIVRVQGAIGDLQMRNFNGQLSAGCHVLQVTTNSTVNRLSMSGMNLQGGGTYVKMSDTGAVVEMISMTNIIGKTMGFLIDTARATEVFAKFAGVIHDATTNGSFLVRSGANLRIVTDRMAAGAPSTTGGFLKVSGDLECDVSLLARSVGSQAYNTNAALSCGVGRVICDGTNWKNLFTGLTY